MNAGTVEKLLRKIEDIKEALARRKDAAAKEAFEELRAAEGAFLEALAEKGMRFEKGKIIGAGEEEDKGVSESKKTAELYSYEYFAQKDDMPVTAIDDTVEYELNKATREGIVDQAQKNAIEYGATVNENGNPVIHVADADLDVILGKNGLRHGLDRRLNVNAPVTLKAGEILANAIRVNELRPRKETITASYVLIGVAKNSRNEPYIVEFVVNQSTNEVTSVDVLYSVNAKTNPAKEKESAGSLSPEVTDIPATLTDSVISIAQLLDFVNRYFPDVMPEDVYRHYGHSERPAGVLGKSAKHSRKATAKPPEVDHLTPMQKQTVANYTRARVYTKAEALAVVEDMAHFLDESYSRRRKIP